MQFQDETYINPYGDDENQVQYDYQEQPIIQQYQDAEPY